MWNVLVAPSLMPPAVPLLDATDFVRLIASGAAAATVAALCCVAAMARHRAAPRLLVARHAFAPPGRDRRQGHAHPSAA